MSEKRFESSLLTDTIIAEVANRKKKREQDKVDSKRRKILRYSETVDTLQIDVQNLQWKKQKLEHDTLELAVEKAREEGRIEGRNAAIASITATARSNVAPSPAPIIVYTPILPQACPTSVIDPIVCPSSYVHDLQSPKPTALSITASEYVPIPSTSTVSVSTYTPQRMRSTTNARENPIKSLSNRADSYWKRMALDIEARMDCGKRLYRNPVDSLIFKIHKYDSGVITVRLGEKWHTIQGYKH